MRRKINAYRILTGDFLENIHLEDGNGNRNIKLREVLGETNIAVEL
jgi:hypothetical protein